MTVTALYRYPVKSMLGESLDRCRVDERGVVGDRAYALVDVETGTVASAKVPSLWGGLFGFSARCVGEPERAAPPLVEITFPDGSVHHSGDPDIDAAAGVRRPCGAAPAHLRHPGPATRARPRRHVRRAALPPQHRARRRRRRFRGERLARPGDRVL